MLKPTIILTSLQLTFLEEFNTSPFTNEFYLSGGTALCGFYIPYRMSEDLDFFSEKEFDTQDILTWIKSCKKLLNYTSFDIQTSFNRNLIFLKYKKEALKTEFTYYPFPNKNVQKYKNIAIDSIEDIAINKLFTMYQNPRLRDFMDLYMIMKKEQFNFEKLRIDAKTKFDWDINPIQLGSQLLSIKGLKDRPYVTEKFDFSAMNKYFQDKAIQLKEEVLQ